MPSAASAVSVMLPGLGAIKALGYAGKMMGLASKFSRPVKWAMEGITGAAIARLGENGMEAGNTFDEEYNKLIAELFNSTEIN